MGQVHGSSCTSALEMCTVITLLLKRGKQAQEGPDREETLVGRESSSDVGGQFLSHCVQREIQDPVEGGCKGAEADEPCCESLSPGGWEPGPGRLPFLRLCEQQQPGRVRAYPQSDQLGRYMCVYTRVCVCVRGVWTGGVCTHTRVRVCSWECGVHTQNNRVPKPRVTSVLRALRYEHSYLLSAAPPAAPPRVLPAAPQQLSQATRRRAKSVRAAIQASAWQMPCRSLGETLV